jgi:hypothetical protein
MPTSAPEKQFRRKPREARSLIRPYRGQASEVDANPVRRSPEGEVRRDERIGASSLEAAFQGLAFSENGCQNRQETADRSKPNVPTARAAPGLGFMLIGRARNWKYPFGFDGPIRKFDNISSAVLIYFSILEMIS